MMDLPHSNSEECGQSGTTATVAKAEPTIPSKAATRSKTHSDIPSAKTTGEHTAESKGRAVVTSASKV